MIKYIRAYPETYKRFSGWVYTSHGHTPTYLEFCPPGTTYCLLREFFGQMAVIPAGIVTAEQMYTDAKSILEKYEFQITGGKKANPISTLAVQFNEASFNKAPLMTEDPIDHIPIPDEKFWNDLIANSPGPNAPF